LGRYEDALADYSSAIRLDPFYPDSYFNRGNIYLTLRDYRRSIEDYNLVLSLNPHDAETFTARGIAKVKLGGRAAGCDDLGRPARLIFQLHLTVIPQNGTMSLTSTLRRARDSNLQVPFRLKLASQVSSRANFTVGMSIPTPFVGNLAGVPHHSSSSCSGG